MRSATAEQMRELDRRTIEETGVPGPLLMERAGRGLARAIRHLAEQLPIAWPSILLVAGRGNNGGDAFVAARLLHQAGFPTRLLLAAPAEKLAGDARVQFDAMTEAHVAWEERAEEADWPESTLDEPEADIVVDGLLGTGSRGAPRGAVAAALRYIESLADHARVVAIDVPSGLDPDTGEPAPGTVRADLTVTFALPKPGLLRTDALECIGHVEVVDIGIPHRFVAELPSASGPDLIARAEVAASLPRRARDSHKGSYGHVLLIGGAPGYAGAIGLAARAALRSGAGLVTVLVPRLVAAAVAAMAPEAMVVGGAESDSGSLDCRALDAERLALSRYDAVLIGPGMTPHPQTLELVQRLLRDIHAPLVIDADALNALAGRVAMLKVARVPVVLTPHPGELGRLLGRETPEIQADRIGAARAAVAATGAVVALKGAGTLVACPDGGISVNLTGNPGMATGGSGDVLAGMLTALLGQGVKPGDAARSAVYLHGLAGDLASWSGSEHALVAGDLIAQLPQAFAYLRG